VKDVAIATVVVAGVAPALPKTGTLPSTDQASWAIALMSFLGLVGALAVMTKKQKI